MESEAYLETSAPSKESKVENLTKWMKSIQDDSDESGVSYFSSEGTVLIDDRDIAKCAIAVAKANAKKGFVSLCTYIARILKQNTKLRKKLQYLRACVNNAESVEFPSQNNKPESCSRSASGSFKQISGILRRPFKDKKSKNGKLNTDLDDESDKVKTSHAESPQSNKPTSKEHALLTQAVVHRSPQSTSTDQSKKFSPIQQSVIKNSVSVDENRSEEEHRSSSPLSQSSDTSPENMNSRVYKMSNKSRSSSGSSGSPKLTSICEDIPLDVFILDDQPTESLPNASEETCCKDTEKVTAERCKCARHWMDKYSKISQELKRMKRQIDTLREELIYQRSLSRDPSESSVKKANNTDGMEDPKHSSIATSTEAPVSDSTSSSAEPDWLNHLMQQNLTPLMAPTPLKGCKCTNCELAIRQETLKAVDEDEIEVFELVYKGKPLLEVSANVMIPGNTIAQVAYVGHLDSTDMPAAVFVGVTVAQPIGNSNGCYAGKRYFQCPPKHGIFMPINQILFVVSPATSAENDVQKKAPLRKQRSNSHPGRTSQPL